MKHTPRLVAWLALMLGCSSAPARREVPLAPTPASAPALVPAPTAAPAPRPLGAEPRLVPVENAVALSVGATHACVVRADGRALCWGDDSSHRLGQRSNESSETPLEVGGVDQAVDVAAGGTMTCVLRADGSAMCWGGHRRVKDVDEEEDWPLQRAPHVVAYPVASTRHLALGWNRAVLLDAAGGVAVVDDYVGPVPLPDFAPASEIAALTSGLCALGRDGRVQCVTEIEYGGLGNGRNETGMAYPHTPGLVLAPLTWADSMRPAFFNERGYAKPSPCDRYDNDPVPAFCHERLVGATHLDGHDDLACAVLADGGLACWSCAHCRVTGNERLGTPSGVKASVPFRIQGVEGVARVAVGGAHLCTLHTDGSVRCWGQDGDGQLGPRGAGDTSIPISIPGLEGVVELDAGDATTCALLEDRRVVCWGRVLGTGSTGRR